MTTDTTAAATPVLPTFNVKVKDSHTLCIVGTVPMGLRGAKRVRVTSEIGSMDVTLTGQNEYMLWSKGVDFKLVLGGACKAAPLDVVITVLE